MPSDPKRVQEALQRIQQIKEGRDRIVKGPWQEMPEPSKLTILQESVDWSGITSRDQAHILRAHTNFSQLDWTQRQVLIGMEGISESHEQQEAAWEKFLDGIPRSNRGEENDLGIGR